MVIKWSLGGEFAGGWRSTSKSTCVVPARTLTSENSSLILGSVQAGDRINWPLTPRDVYFFENACDWSLACENSLFCLARGCTNSRFITAELQNPRTREHVSLGSVSRATGCRPRAQQGLGARSARIGRWLVPAATDVAAVTVISAGPTA